jgi:thioredoxin 1
MIPTEGKVLVDFYADWCGPCKVMSREGGTLDAFQQISDVPLVKINVDQEREIATKYDVRGIPCFIYFEDGVAKARATGVQSLQQLKNLTK